MARTEQDQSHRASNRSAFRSPTFNIDAQIRVNETVGSASISPSGRDVVLASREGLHIIDLDSPYSPPRHLVHHSLWDVADVQWSPFASKDYWIVSTSNQKALVWNLNLYTSHAPIEHILHAHSRAITDINFSAHDPEMLATCAVDSYVHCWDLRHPARPAMTFADWNAGATQVKWNRQEKHIIASSHDRFLKIWDTRRGAYPLRTIEAHSTKIYGIDWNRTRETGIITCSLDRTVKFWDYSKAFDEPERVIRTPFPVWRARHTPFGWGLLAMPQRGDTDLHLYDRRLGADTPLDGHIKPVHSFTGHQDVVKEFLWRSRGNIDDGVDNRDFQLISWGADRDLHLHHIDAKHILAIGHEKHKQVRKKLNLTRLGAVYKTFRDEKAKQATETAAVGTHGMLKPQGAALLSAAFKLGRTSSLSHTLNETGFMTASFNTFGKKRLEKTVDPMSWIEGVKIGRRATDAAANSQKSSRMHGDTPEPLSDEMMFVSKKYKKVTFEKADVHGREVIVTLHGPWGQDEKSVFLRVHFTFPLEYPDMATPEIQIDRSTSAIFEDTMRKLQDEVFSIIGHFKDRRRGCLEAVITYLLGEKDLAESMTLIPHDGLGVPFTSPADELSSDEEDGIGAQEDLETSGTVLTTQNFPIPRKCGAVWAGDGSLVCFFLPRPDADPIFTLDALRTDRARRIPKQFEGFGRLRDESIGPKDRSIASDDEDDHESSGSWTDSASSSDESDDISHLPARFKVPMAWRPQMIRNSGKPSSHSSGGLTRKNQPAKVKSTISLHDFSELLPAKKALAQEYKVFGNGPAVCDHNALVASRLGYDTLSAVWLLCKQILYDEVPLEELEQTRRKDPILVLARRNAVRIKRKDSGLDIGFDEPDSVARPRFRGRVKWGKHPLASAWLIPALFTHYEQQADIQMLAMLSCIFSEPAAEEGMHNALLNLKAEDLPIAAKAPAFSLDYFPSREVAWSQFFAKRLTSRTTTPTPSHATDYFTKQPATFGSLGSSNGPWQGDGLVQLLTPLSNDSIDTPPLSRQTTVASSLSTSPEPSVRVSRRSNSSLSHAFASLSRPFSINLSASPPIPERLRTSEVDLSTSAPTTAITWGATTSFSSSPNSPILRRTSNARASSFATYDSTYSSDEALDEVTDDDEDSPALVSQVRPASPTVKLTLKNQHMFDDEGYGSVPLLSSSQAMNYTLYREAYTNLLGQWQLHVAQAEISKFNGLTPYWPKHWEANKNTNGNQSAVQLPARSSSFLMPSLFGFAHQPASSSQSRRASATSPTTRPLNPTATPFVPSPQPFQAQGDMFRLSRSSSQADLQSYLSQGSNSSGQIPERFEVAQYTRELNAQVQNSLVAQATNHARVRAEEKALGNRASRTQQRTCIACWEFVRGIHVVCITGNHRAHVECVADRTPAGYFDAMAPHSLLKCPCEVDINDGFLKNRTSAKNVSGCW